jgi:hypothetical protein
MSDERHDRCARCGCLRSAHLTVGADGGSVEAVICPSAVYLSPRDEATGAADPWLQKLADDAMSAHVVFHAPAPDAP